MSSALRPPYATHEVFNQPPPLEGYNLYTSDPVLQAAVEREGAAHAHGWLTTLGQTLGGADMIHHAQLANEYPPTLKTHNRFGDRIDEVSYHPSYHTLMSSSVSYGLHNLPWVDPTPGNHVARAAGFFLAAQNELGHCCPISMTCAIWPSLKKQPDVLEPWRKGLSSRHYDPALIPGTNKQGVIMGMAMTEKQGGSDVQANTTQAEEGEGAGPWRTFLLSGHKWFCSAPMSDAFLMLARVNGGLSCFLVPRFLPDGRRNHIFIQRLKDKLGNRSNASSEIELYQAEGYLVGEEGRGVPTIIEMVNSTRLDCTLGSAAIMRAALVQARHHCEHRSAFKKKLIDQPLMLNVLADLALEVEAATTLALRVARAYDGLNRGDNEGLFRRISSAIAKYWVCKRTPMVTLEALECLGGAGYVEESGMPRLLRESPLNSIWEGSGNVMCLDVFRALYKSPGVLDTLEAELQLAKGGHPLLDHTTRTLLRDIRKESDPEGIARIYVEKMALTLQASLLVRFSTTQVADTFCRTRLGGEHGVALGTLPRDTPLAHLLNHNWVG